MLGHDLRNKLCQGHGGSSIVRLPILVPPAAPLHTNAQQCQKDFAY